MANLNQWLVGNGKREAEFSSQNHKKYFKNLNRQVTSRRMTNTTNYLGIYFKDFNFSNNEFSETTLVKALEITLNFRF